MLEIIEYGKDEYAFPSLLVLGCFDAIHVGHRELFKKAKLQAKINGLDLGVMMFRDGKGGKQVYSFEERVSMLSAYNVKFVLVIDFTPEFKQTAPLDFLAAIEEKVNVKAYMSGKDFRFGKGAKGKSSTLKNYAEDEENGVWYMPVKDITYEGEKISTTLIKSCLDSGDVHRASALLGEDFFVEGSVVEGAHRGTGVLGFPTINISYPEWKYPVRHGVYKVNVTVDGNVYSGIANFGGRPTFGDDSEVLEVHIKDFQGDLYGKAVKVSFVGFMRDIVKFADAQALAAQLERDKSALDLSDEQFFGLYPLEECPPAIEEAESAVLEKESEPPAEVFEGVPAEAPETEYVAEEQAQPAEEVVSDEQVVADNASNEITPAWELLSESVKEGEEIVEVTPANVVEEISEEISARPAEEQPEEVLEHAAEEASEEVNPAEQVAEIVEDMSEAIDSEEVSDAVAGETVQEEMPSEQTEQPQGENSEETAEEDGCAEEGEQAQHADEITEDEIKDILDEDFESVVKSILEEAEEHPKDISVEITEQSDAQETAEEPIEETTDEVTEEVAEQTADESFEESAEEENEELTEQPAEETSAENSIDSVDGLAGDENQAVDEEISEEIAEEVAEEIADAAVQEATEEAAVEFAEQIADGFSEEVADESAEEITEELEKAEETAEETLALAEHNIALVERKVALAEQKVALAEQKVSLVAVQSPSEDDAKEEKSDDSEGQESND